MQASAAPGTANASARGRARQRRGFAATLLRVVGIGLLLHGQPALALAQIEPADTEPVDPALVRALKHAVEDARSFADRFDAQVWLLDMSSRLEAIMPDPVERLQLLKVLHAEATRAGLRPELVLAVIHVESYFDRFAISRSGARGLMQVMPFWMDEIGHPEDNLFKLQTNLRYGCTILRYYLDMEDGNLPRALGRYNGSLGSWRYPEKVFAALRNHWYAR